ncbi:MAG: methyltransferase domain-containing protein [Thermodesulfovibrionales bacterium]
MQAYCRWLCDFFLDFRYGGYFGGKLKSRYAHLGAYDTQSINYSVLSCIFRKYKIKDSDVLVDVGCGKGRVINWWLKQGHQNRMIGLELDGAIAEQTRKRFESYKNVEIIYGNALENIPEYGTIFFLYNPFDRSSTRAFKDRLKEKVRNRVQIIYANCEHLDAFSADTDWTIRTNSDFFKNDNGLILNKLDLPTSYPIAVIERNEH